MTRRLNVAVVGLGIGREHLQAYAALPNRFTVIAVCDLDAAKAAAVAAEFGVARSVTDFAGLLSARDIDIIDICTPPASHRSLIEQALAAGFHVICEKPLTGSLAEVDAIAAVAAKARGTLSPIFQYRFGNGLQKLKHLQAKGVCGKPYLATIETAWKRTADYYTVPWRGKWASELGGCCLTHAIHAHDILSYVNGPVQRLSAHVATRVNAIEVEDCAAISVAMANGSLATLAVTLGAAEEISRLRFMFSGLTAESRSANPYRPGSEPWHFKGTTAESDAAIEAALVDFAPSEESFVGQLARIHTALTQGGPLPVTLADARASLELITAIYHAAETACTVDLPIPPDHARYASWVPAQLRSS